MTSQWRPPQNHQFYLSSILCKYTYNASSGIEEPAVVKPFCRQCPTSQFCWYFSIPTAGLATQVCHWMDEELSSTPCHELQVTTGHILVGAFASASCVYPWGKSRELPFGLPLWRVIPRCCVVHETLRHPLQPWWAQIQETRSMVTGSVHWFLAKPGLQAFCIRHPEHIWQKLPHSAVFCLPSANVYLSSDHPSKGLPGNLLLLFPAALYRLVLNRNSRGSCTEEQLRQRVLGSTKD